jgi:hypothetical protein
MLPFHKLQALIKFSAQLRRDPEEIEREKTEQWIEENQAASFAIVNDDGTEEIFTIEEFLSVAS